MNTYFSHTRCYTKRAYRTLKMLYAIHLARQINIIGEDDKLIAKVNTDRFLHLRRMSGFLVKAFDNEILIMKATDELDPLPPLLCILNELIGVLKEKSCLKPDTPFWFAQFSTSLKVHLKSAANYWETIYENEDYDEVIKNESFSISMLEKVISDLKTPTTAERIEDPFIIEKKRALLQTVTKHYNELLEDFNGEINRLAEKYSDIRTLRGTNFPLTILSDSHILKYMLHGEYDKVENFVRICASDQYLMYENEDYLNDLCLYVNKILHSELFKSYRDAIVEISDEALGFPALQTLTTYFITFGDKAISSL